MSSSSTPSAGEYRTRMIFRALAVRHHPLVPAGREAGRDRQPVLVAAVDSVEYFEDMSLASLPRYVCYRTARQGGPYSESCPNRGSPKAPLSPCSTRTQNPSAGSRFILPCKYQDGTPSWCIRNGDAPASCTVRRSTNRNGWQTACATLAASSTAKMRVGSPHHPHHPPGPLRSFHPPLQEQVPTHHHLWRLRAVCFRSKPLSPSLLAPALSWATSLVPSCCGKKTSSVAFLIIDPVPGVPSFLFAASRSYRRRARV